MKKVAVIGGGSVGLTYAAFLAPVAQVVVIARRSEQAGAIKSKGVCLIIKGEEVVTGEIDSTTDIGRVADCDAVLVAVKSYDTWEVAQMLNKFIKPEAMVLTLQNGLQAFDVLRSNIDNPKRVFAGVTYVGATRTDDRTVKQGKLFTTIIDSKAKDIVEMLKQTRFGVEPSENITQVVWDKMVLNTGQNALSAITGLHFGEMLESEYCLDIAGKTLQEFQTVAESEGISFEDSLMDRLKNNWKGSVFYPSMWQDLHHGRRTEIDAINGTICVMGKKHKIATPYNDMITSLIKIAESKTQKL